MNNLAVSSNIMKSFVSLPKKPEPAAAEPPKKTFQSVLSETVLKKTNTIPAASVAYSAADIENDDLTVSEETLTKISKYADPSQAKILDNGRLYAEYVDVEMNGVWVKQLTDDFLTAKGFNVEVMRANNLYGEDEMYLFVDEYGFAPRFIIPHDWTGETDYTKTLATPENLARTAANNFALFGPVTTYNPTTAAEILAAMNGSYAPPPKEVKGAVKYTEDVKTVKTEDVKTVKTAAETGDIKDVTDVAEEDVKDEHIIQTYSRSTRQPSETKKPAESIENIFRTFASRTAFRILSGGMNVADILDREKEGEDKNK